MTEYPILKTNRLLLRQFIASDLENVYKGLSHPDIIKYYGVSYETLEETKQQMTWFSNLEKEETGIWWAICSLDNTIFYGAIGINDVNKDHQKGEIGFWLLQDFWRKGIITEAMPVICDYVFKHLNLHRIEAVVEIENQNSINVLTKLNFIHEGTMRDCEIKNNQYISLHLFSKIKSDENR